MKRPRGRFRIRITKSGYLFIILCLGVGLSALNTGNNLLYLVFAMMLSFIILSGLLSNNTLQNVVVHPSFPHRIFAKQKIPVEFRLTNEKRWFPSYSLSLSIPSFHAEGAGHPYIMKISPQHSVSASDQIEFPRRGRTNLPEYVVETEYPFGLIQKFRTLPSQGEALVYPELLPVDAWLALDRRLHGEFLSGVRGGDTNPYGLRDFRYGDSARHIHWKSSAKTGSWKTKEFEKEKRLRVEMDVRLAKRSETDPRWLEKAISAAASILVSLSNRGFEVVLRLNGTDVPSEGRSFIDAYLSALALAESPTNTTEPRAASPGTMTVVVSDLPRHSLHGDIVFGREELSAL